MNVNKMRKNLGRHYPDEISSTFDYMSDNHGVELREWCGQFRRAMEIKHPGKRFVIDLETHPEKNLLLQYTGIVMISARYREIKR